MITDLYTINTGVVVNVGDEEPRYASGNQNVFLDDW